MIGEDENIEKDQKIVALANFIDSKKNEDSFIQHWILDFSFRSKIKSKKQLILDLYYPHLVGTRKHKEVLKHLKSGLILDAGCGTGWLSLQIFKNGHKVVCIDLSATFISLAKKLFDVEKVDIPIVRASLTALPFRSEVFDSIVMCDVVEHIPKLDLAMSEVKQVLKSNANACVTIPNGFGWWELGIKFFEPIFRFLNLKRGDVEEKHVNYFTERKLEKLLHLHGFNNIYIQNIYAISSIHSLGIIPKFVNTIDSRIAHKLPKWLGTEWFVTWKK